MRSRLGVILVVTAVLATACSQPAEEAGRVEERPPGTSTSAAEPSPGDDGTETGDSPVGTAPPVTLGTAGPVLSQATLDRRLLDAAWANDLPRARRLIAAGADVNATDETVQSAYLVATSEGYRELLELTLRNGADVNAKDSFNGTGLIRAADRGHAAIAGRLVRAGVAVNHVNRLGWTALHEAIVLGDGGSRYLDTVRVLVAAGADLRLPSVRDGVTPLAHARSRGFTEIARTLRRGLDTPRLTRAEANRRLLAAAGSGDADGVAVARRAGARLETRDARRRTPLLLAAAADRLATARLLVDLGADPDALDDRHDTPWLVTGVTGSVPMLEILLRAGPDLGLLNRFGGTSLIPASERGHVAYVRRAVRTGIDVDHVNDLGWTALLEAVILGDGTRRYQQIVSTLLSAGADPGIPDRNGVTALTHAQRNGHDAVARLLRRASGS